MLSFLVVGLSIFISVLFVTCLKTSLKGPSEAKGVLAGHDLSEVYEKAKKVEPVPTKQKRAPAKKDREANKLKKMKKPENAGLHTNPKKINRFFLFPTKSQDLSLKTPKSEELSACSTQKTNDLSKTDEELEAPLEIYEFSEKECYGNLQILPSPDPKALTKLKQKAKKRKYFVKSPDDVDYSEDEDSLYNVPSLQMDPNTLTSSKSNIRAIPIERQDSGILHVDPERTLIAKADPALRSQFAYPTNKEDEILKSSF